MSFIGITSSHIVVRCPHSITSSYWTTCQCLAIDLDLIYWSPQASDPQPPTDAFVHRPSWSLHATIVTCSSPHSYYIALTSFLKLLTPPSKWHNRKLLHHFLDAIVVFNFGTPSVLLSDEWNPIGPSCPIQSRLFQFPTSHLNSNFSLQDHRTSTIPVVSSCFRSSLLYQRSPTAFDQSITKLSKLLPASICVWQHNSCLRT